MFEKINKILNNLGFLDKAKAGTLSKAEWKLIAKSYKEEYKSDFNEDIAKEDDEKQKVQMASLQKILSSVAPVAQDDPEDEAQGDKKPETQDSATPAGAQAAKEPDTSVKEDDMAAAIKSAETLVAKNAALQKQVNTLSNQAAVDHPETVAVAVNIDNMSNNTTKKSLFGIDNPIFSMEKRWNKISHDPRIVATLSDPGEQEVVAFKADMRSYSASLQQRYNHLLQNKQLDPKKLSAGEFSTNTTSVDGSSMGNLADQYIVRRQDALIARIIQIKSVSDLFPTQYGVQDRTLMFSAYFEEVSQAYQKGKVWKGGMKIEPEWGYVDDAMVKVMFGPMKDLERKYIGYLNKENSDPIKWSLIEFALINVYTKMQMEQNTRHIMGIYKTPEDGVAGNALNAGTGVYYTLARAYHELSLKLNDSAAYRTYDKSSFVDSVKEFVSDVMSQLDEGADLSGSSIYLNKNHYSWWLEGLRAKYGLQTDFTTGPTAYANVVPDTELPIKWVPNLGQETLMFIQEPGNITFLEFAAGEMLNVKMKDDMEIVYGWSTWKEGCAPSFAGPHFLKKDDLDANNYSLQRIFMNKPAATVAADATTITVDRNRRWYLTGTNTKATAITNIVGAKEGAAYIIEIGDAAFPSSIDKAGKFATISSAFTPTAVGDYIMVILNSEGNFDELERSIAGTRAVNAKLQPNVPGAR